jgi:DNA polymerase-3 subunit epsilon
MLDALFGYEAKRKRLLRKAPNGPLSNFLSVPFPQPDTPIDKVPILAVDFETTGLNPARDQILSVGYISIENDEILVSSAYHQVIRTRGQLAEENVVIHQITDDTKSEGKHLHSVIEDLLNALSGKVMLVHFAQIERSFLQRACKQLYGIVPVIPIIDTLDLAKRRLDQRTAPYSPNELRLFTLRSKHQLPRYQAHNALSDALATAELFFAEVGLKNNKKTPVLRSLLL